MQYHTLPSNTILNHLKPGLTGTDWYRPGLTGTDQSQLWICVHLKLLHFKQWPCFAPLAIFANIRPWVLPSKLIAKCCLSSVTITLHFVGEEFSLTHHSSLVIKTSATLAWIGVYDKSNEVKVPNQCQQMQFVKIKCVKNVQNNWFYARISLMNQKKFRQGPFLSHFVVKQHKNYSLAYHLFIR